MYEEVIVIEDSVCDCCRERPEDNEYVDLSKLRTRDSTYREMRGSIICKVGCFDSDFTFCTECHRPIPLDEAYGCDDHFDRCYLHRLPHQDKQVGISDHTAKALWMQGGRLHKEALKILTKEE